MRKQNASSIPGEQSAKTRVSARASKEIARATNKKKKKDKDNKDKLGGALAAAEGLSFAHFTNFFLKLVKLRVFVGSRAFDDVLPMLLFLL